MTSFSFFTLNVFINSFLMFFTVLFLIETVIFLTKIRPGRFTSLLRMIPILKLPFDLFLYDFSVWSFLKGINPLLEEEGSRQFSIAFAFSSECLDFFSSWSFITFSVCGGSLTFTLADLLGYSLPTMMLTIFSICLLSCSLYLLAKKIIQYRRFLTTLKNIPHSRFKNCLDPSIKNILYKKTCSIVISPHLKSSPFVVGLFTSTIYIPEHLYQAYSPQEYQAALTHEMEHIHHKDNLVRFILLMISSFYCWIPTKKLLNKIEEGLEISSDRQCMNYGVNPIDLASAIYKSVCPHFKHSYTPMYLAKHPISKRISFLLFPPAYRLKKCVFPVMQLWPSLLFLQFF